MKIIQSLALFALFSGSAWAATYTAIGNWDVVVNQTITATAPTLNGTANQGTLTEVLIPFFDASAHLGETLVGVTVTYSAPLTGQSPAIVETVSSATGSNTFTTLSASAQTTIDSPTLVSLFSAASLDTTAFDVGTFQKTANHNFGATTVTAGSPVAASVSRTYTTSPSYFSATDSTTLAQFVGFGNISFDVTSNVNARFIRTTATNDVTFGYAGTDSGTITVTYTTVPEASATLLAGGGVLLLLRRRRR